MLIAIPSQVLWSSVTAPGAEGLSPRVTELTSNSQLYVSAQITWEFPPSQFSLRKGRHERFPVRCNAGV